MERSSPRAGPVDVSVLVPVLNEEAHIRDTAAAMLDQRFEGEIEFLFVEGRSSDRTRAVLEELAGHDPRVQVLDNPARRTPNALNIGLRAARGEFVARMDAHTYYPPEYVAKGVERLRHGDVAWVSGPQVADGNGRWSRRVTLALGSRLGVGGSSKWLVERETELDSGVFAGVWRRSTLEGFGGWDEGWPANQDSELAARVLGAGGRIVCLPELGARYVPRNSLGGLARQYRRYGFYRAKTSRRHPHSMRRSHLLPPGLVLALLGALVAPTPLRRPARAALAAYMASVVAASIAAARRGRGADAAALPAVFATMHLSWGVGFLAGCARFGPPLAALARVAGLSGLRRRRGSLLTAADCSPPSRGVEGERALSP
jgi:succinoglycan biosynthesis protein ExoA